jgi:hypothetical protein
MWSQALDLLLTVEHGELRSSSAAASSLDEFLLVGADRKLTHL